MKLFLLLVLFVTLVAIGESTPNVAKQPSSLSQHLEKEWEKFKNKFHKTYKNAKEEAYRKGIFAKNLKEIEEHNKKYDAGEVSYRQGINQFSDKEFGEIPLGLLTPPYPEPLPATIRPLQLWPWLGPKSLLQLNSHFNLGLG